MAASADPPQQPPAAPPAGASAVPVQDPSPDTPAAEAHGRWHPAVAVAVVVGLALVAAALFVGLTRRTAAEPRQEVQTPADSPAPELLADGGPPGAGPSRLPEEVTAPVVAARAQQDPLAAGLCFGHGPDGPIEDPQVETALVTVDFLYTSAVGRVTEPGFGPGDGPQRMECTSGPDGFSNGGTGPLEGEGVSIGGCCLPDGSGYSSTRLAVPAEVDWVLVDEGGWWQAFPTQNEVSWIYWTGRRFGRAFDGGAVPGTTALLVTDDGRLLGERPVP